jgi:Cu-Zn family superoxide dismutase
MKRLGMITLVLAVAIIGAVWALHSGAQEASKAGEKTGDKDKITKAVCVIAPVGGKGVVNGVLYFTQKGKTVEITGEVTGLKPGKHGFHVHEFGDLTSKDGMATGGHFNPEGTKHGGHHADERHVGDLGNIVADKDGTAVVKMTDKLISLHGPHSIIGRAIIVHADADDEKSQPAGNAGARIGAGVIGVAKGEEKKGK